MTYSLSKEEFIKAAEAGYNLIPLSRSVMADRDTPLSAFLKVDNGVDSFLLESVEGGEKWGRYSFIGVKSSGFVRSKGEKIEISDYKGLRAVKGNPFDVLKDYMAGFTVMPLKDGLMPIFEGGLIGYLGYDIVRHFETLPDTNIDDLNLYDMYFIISDTVLIFDNMAQKIIVNTNAFIGDSVDPGAVYDDAVKSIDDAVLMLLNNDNISRNPVKTTSCDDKFTSNFNKDDFLSAVAKTKEYIKSGDIFQCVIGQRFETKLDVEPINIYRALRVINPSPYMFFLRLGEVILVGSSPEILVRAESGKICVRPIAGTRPRGKTEEEDKNFEIELLKDPKERAEHIMLVDLGRNDIGRVSKEGTVKVDELMIVERYSHVMHIVSNVVGELKDGAGAFEALSATFPAGTLTGAPKIRAMEIIEELEPCKRGIYGGSVGYFGYSGNMDMCITIRTIVIKDDKIFVQAGAGIVADSVAEKEFEETENKAKGMLKAVTMAREGLN